MTTTLRASAVCLLICLLVPSSARADWLLAFYAGGSDTASNTLTITPPSSTAVTIPNVQYEGNSWGAPIYYGYRVGWTPTGRHLGVEAEFTHAKAIASQQPSADLTAFQLSHGLNFILGNVAYHTSPFCGGRCTFVARGGAGITYPHVEATFRDVRTFEYEYAGLGLQGGLGVEFKIVPHLFVIADARLTHARVRTNLVDGGQLAGGFTTGHADFGIAWKSSR